MAFEIGQSSNVAPSVTFWSSQGDGSFYMAFKSLDGSNRLLMTSSDNGVRDSWDSETDTGQSTSSAPALVVVSDHLVVVFVSNDASNRILYGVFNNRLQLEFVKETGESAQAVTAFGVGDSLLIYFVSNDNTDRLLGTEINVQVALRQARDLHD